MPAKPLKIAFLLDTSLDPGDGVQQYILSLGGWLTGQGHEVHYLVGETTERVLPNIHSLCKNVRVNFNGNRTTIPLWVTRNKARQLLVSEHFDVIHVQSPHHPFMAQRVICAAPANTAVVATFHILPYGQTARYATKLLGWSLRPSLKRIDQMLAVSSSAAAFEQWGFGVPAKVLPNVFDYERFHKASPFDKYIDDKVTILFLGRLVERKGCMRLLEAIAWLERDKLPAFRVVICGKGQLLSELQSFVHTNELQDIVEFVGFVSEVDKPRYYASADISVFPSTGGESFGIVLLEAMASGRATVLAGDNPGYSTVMEPKPELLFDPANDEGLAEILSEYITNVAKRKQISKWGSHHSKEFDVKVVGPKLVEVYQNAIAKRSVAKDNSS